MVCQRDKLIAGGKLRPIKRIVANQVVFEVTCPPGADDERGADLDLQQDPAKVIRWS